MEVINTDIEFVVEVEDLDSGTYTAHLWDKHSGVVVKADTTAPATGSNVYKFVFSETDTSKFDDGTIVALEIFQVVSNVRKSIFYKDRFGRIRETSATKETVS